MFVKLDLQRTDKKEQILGYV